MRLAVLTLAAVAIAVLTVNAGGQDTTVSVVPNGGAAGGPALYLERGDLLGVRNIQGGVADDANLDIGAGSTANPGDVVVNYDVGRRLLIFDGHKRLLASFGPGGIHFYVRPRGVLPWWWSTNRKARHAH